jgi:hypothetical protein
MTVQTAEPLPADDVSKYLDVNMAEHFDYELPGEVDEWGWIEHNARWAHLGNGEEGGVWEFMVPVSKLDLREKIPVKLLPFFENAKALQCTWVLFHQG